MRLFVLTGVMAMALALQAQAFEADHVERLKSTGSCENCDLGGASLMGLSLSGAKLNRTNLRESDLKNIDVTGSDMSSADLRRCNLEKSGKNIL